MGVFMEKPLSANVAGRLACSIMGVLSDNSLEGDTESFKSIKFFPQPARSREEIEL